MNYSKQEFGQALKSQLLSGYDIVRFARWAHDLFLEHSSHLEPGLQEVLMQIVAMEEGPEFEFSESELEELSKSLITDVKDIKATDSNRMLSVPIDPDIAAFVHQLAERKNIGIERMVNEWLRKNMELIQAVM
ncbi:MAG TPA: hypothetical protein ENK58_00115 [Desulfobacterales bacterium]|nr:hypothetical protein [Desulfobacterales bacterium]